jgi:hypothetical protein
VQQEIGREQPLRTLRAAEPISTVSSPPPSVWLTGWSAARHLLFLLPTNELCASELRIRYIDLDDLLTQLALLARAITFDPEGLQSPTRQLRQVNQEPKRWPACSPIWNSGSASTLPNERRMSNHREDFYHVEQQKPEAKCQMP